MPFKKHEPVNKKYNLSILINGDGFSFSVNDSDTGDVLSLEHKKFDNILSTEVLIDMVEHAVKEFQLSEYQFNQVAVFYQTQKFVLCPPELFDQEKNIRLFNFEHKLDALEELRHVHETVNNVYVIFGIPTELVTMLFKYFGNDCSIFPTVYSHLKQPKEASNQAILHVGNEHFDLVVIKDNYLHLLNTFTYLSVNDFIYHIMNTLRQLDIGSDNILLRMHGKISRYDEKFIRLKKYLAHVKLADTRSVNGPLYLTQQLKLYHWPIIHNHCA